MTEPSEQMRQDLITRAVKMLVMAKVDFKVIFGHHEFGNLAVVPPKQHKERNVRNKGVVDYIKQYVDGMKEGDVVVVPSHPTFTGSVLQGNIGARLTGRYGKGSIITHVTPDGGVEVLLVDANGRGPRCEKGEVKS